MHIEQNNAALQEAAPTPPEIVRVIDSLELEVEADRSAYIKVHSYTNYTVTTCLSRF